MKLSPLQKKAVASMLLVACMNLFLGCQRFYRPVLLNTPSVDFKHTTLKKLSTEDRYFILRKGSKSYHLSNIILDQNNMTITANLNHVSPEHLLYLNNPSKYRFSRARHEESVLREVHVYTGDTSRLDTTTTYFLALSDIQKIEVIEFDSNKTTSSYVWGTLGTILGAALVIAIIAAITYEPPEPEPSSCPYISAYDGDHYALQGEVYSAAIYPSLQKEDYLPLQTKPFKGNYLIKISNELKEIQHTDFADLLMVEHDENVKILMDPDGKVYTISSPQQAFSAILNNQTNVSKELMFKDKSSCLFKDIHSAGNSEDLYITFSKDPITTYGKLILNAKSSSWVSYLYEEFSKGFGSSYNKWVKSQEKKPASELKKWSEEQNIPLTISLKTSSGWKEIKKIQAIGPLLHREVVIPLDLPVSDKVELKISTGFMFWELDYVAMDFSSNEKLSVKEIKPYEAINEDGVNMLQEIIQADKKFIIQPDIGDFTILKYKGENAKDGMVQTVFLHTSGYYTPIREYKGTAKIAFLKSFKKAGALSAFSKQKFSEAINRFETAKN